MSRLLRRPGVHFLVLGLALFLLQAKLFPEPLPSVGPLAPAQVENLRRQWFSATGRMPSEAQLASMVSAELDREIMYREGLELRLYQFDPVVRQRLIRNMRFLGLDRDRTDDELFDEALRMELHLGDEVVKRRLIQVVEQMLLAGRPPVPPTADDIADAFSERVDELALPPRYTLVQVFLTRERADEAATLLESFRQSGIDPELALQSSSPFLPGYRFDRLSPDQLARQFGSAFVLNLQRAEPAAGQWVGPVASTYGTHLVWIEAVEPGRSPELGEVSDRLQRDLELQRRREALDAAVANLRQDYEVML